jgi:hypothetical protein
MIKALVTEFFNEIEKKELKKNKNAQATFWVEELQEVGSQDKNYISVRKATRLYNKYIEEREQVIVKEPNKYILDFMALYLGWTDFEAYQSKKGLKEEKNAPKKTEKKSLLKKHQKTLIGSSVLLLFPVLFVLNKYNINNTETCIMWNETHFEKSDCRLKNTIDNSFYNINIKKFKKVKVTKETPFFKDGNPLIWYGKSSKRKMEYFTQRGIHPETLKELDPITKYIIDKYVVNEKN